MSLAVTESTVSWASRLAGLLGRAGVGGGKTDAHRIRELRTDEEIRDIIRGIGQEEHPPKFLSDLLETLETSGAASEDSFAHARDCLARRSASITPPEGVASVGAVLVVDGEGRPILLETQLYSSERWPALGGEIFFCVPWFWEMLSDERTRFRAAFDAAERFLELRRGRYFAVVRPLAVQEPHHADSALDFRSPGDKGSLALPLALSIVSAFRRRPIDRSIFSTGGIEETGVLRPVGEIAAKSSGLALLPKHTLLVPDGSTGMPPEQGRLRVVDRFEDALRATSLSRFQPRSPWLTIAVLSQGSGELFWWPYLTVKYGVVVLPFIALAALLQWPINYEIARYTVVRGEHPLLGLFSRSKPAGLLFWILFSFSFLWIGSYASLLGNVTVASLTAVFDKAPPHWLEFALTAGWLLLGILLLARTSSDHVNRVRFSFYVLVTAAGVLLLSCVLAVAARLGGLGDPAPQRLPWNGLFGADLDTFVNAVIYTGLGGFWNLLYPKWLFDSGYATKGQPCTSQRLGRLRRRLLLDSGAGCMVNLATTLMICLLALLLLGGQEADPGTITASTIAELRAHVWIGAPFIYVLIIIVFLFDTWPLAIESVASLHSDFLARLTGTNADRLVTRAKYVLAAVTIILAFSGAPREIISFNGGCMMVAGMVLCCLIMITLNLQLPPAFRPSLSVGVLLGATAIVYTVLLVAFFYSDDAVLEAVRSWLGNMGR